MTGEHHLQPVQNSPPSVIIHMCKTTFVIDAVDNSKLSPQFTTYPRKRTTYPLNAQQVSDPFLIIHS